MPHDAHPPGGAAILRRIARLAELVEPMPDCRSRAVLAESLIAVAAAAAPGLRELADLVDAETAGRP